MVLKVNYIGNKEKIEGHKMSIRTCLDGKQIFGNNFYDQRIIDEIRRQGGKFDSENCIRNFKLKDFTSLFEIIKKIDIENINNSIEYPDTDCMSCVDFTKMSMQYDIDNFEMFYRRILGSSYGLYGLAALYFCKNKLEYVYSHVHGHYLYRLKDKHRIIFSRG